MTQSEQYRNALVAAFTFVAASPVRAKGQRTGAQHHTGTHAAQPHAGVKHSGSKAALGVKRDKHGKIARSAEQKDAFKGLHPCSSAGESSGTRPGYVIDHGVPL